MEQQKVKPKDKPHYVNNADFSNAIVEYVKRVNEAKEKGEETPEVTNYIASCFLKIAEGLSHRANFIRYTYREEMVMDAVEDCLKRIRNYDITTKTRTGKPNAFGYFTQISWYAFLRRIAKENREQEIRIKYISQSGLELLLEQELQSNPAARATQAYIEELREKIDAGLENESAVDKIKRKEKIKRARTVDSDLTGFMK